MKILLLFLISFSAFGNYVKQKDFEEKGAMPAYSKMAVCGKNCLKLPGKFVKNGGMESHVLVDELINDKTKPVYSKNELNECGEYCETLFASSEPCLDKYETRYLSEDKQEMYCSKLLRYEQKLSGNKTIILDNDLKIAYLAKIKSERDTEKVKKNELKAIRAILKNRDLTQAELKKVLLHLLKRFK